ncbi:hypothetical protein [Enterococcus hirae]|uniref:hypothetical protein n=1 Tax=Enterococcus hirae TaxID=1354 RepID=UPI0039A522CB
MKNFDYQFRKIFDRAVMPFLATMVLFFVLKENYQTANYFLIILISSMVLERLKQVEKSIYTIAVILNKRNEKDGIE